MEKQLRNLVENKNQRYHYGLSDLVMHILNGQLQVRLTTPLEYGVVPGYQCINLLWQMNVIFGTIDFDSYKQGSVVNIDSYKDLLTGKKWE